MKHYLDVGLGAAVIAAIIALFFRMTGGIPLSVSQVTTNKASTFDVTGEGKVHVVPDRAFVELGVKKSGMSVKTVQDDADKTMNTLTDALKKIGIEDKDIKTTGYNIYPDYNSLTGRPSGYVVSSSVQVRIRNFEHISPVLDLAGTYGLEQIGQLSFILSDELADSTMEEARKAAVDEAKMKAESLARLAGVKLGKIVNVNEYSGGSPGPLLYNAKNTADAMEVSGGADVSPGTNEVTVSVTLSYETL